MNWHYFVYEIQIFNVWNNINSCIKYQYFLKKTNDFVHDSCTDWNDLFCARNSTLSCTKNVIFCVWKTYFVHEINISCAKTMILCTKNVIFRTRKVYFVHEKTFSYAKKKNVRNYIGDRKFTLINCSRQLRNFLKIVLGRSWNLWGNFLSRV